MHHLGVIACVVYQRLRPNRNLVAEHGGHLVRIAGATDIAKQCHPIGCIAHILIESSRLANPSGKQAGTQLRLERLAKRVVLRQGQRGDEFT